MNTQETILQLEGLKLKGMAECYKALQSMPVNQWPTLDTFMARLAETEQQYRNRKRTEMLPEEIRDSDIAASGLKMV